MGINKWTGLLKGCLYDDNTTFSVTNLRDEDRNDVFLVTTVNGANYTFTPQPLEAPSGPVTTEQAARLVTFDILTQTTRTAIDRARFAPGQTVIIHASTGQLNPDDLRYKHDRIITSAAVIGRAMAETAGEKLFTDEENNAQSLAVCAEYMWGQINGSGQAPPPLISNWDVPAYLLYYWAKYNSQKPCIKAWNVLTGQDKPEPKAESTVEGFLDKLLDQGIPTAEGFFEEQGDRG